MALVTVLIAVLVSLILVEILVRLILVTVLVRLILILVPVLHHQVGHLILITEIIYPVV